MPLNATIIVGTIKESSPGRKTFDVLSTDGAKFKVWNTMRGLVMQGQTYEFQFEEKSFMGREGNQITYNQVINVKAPTNGAAQQGRQAAPDPYSRPAKGLPPQPDTGEHIFVAMCVKEAIRSGVAGAGNASEIAMAGRVAQEAYDLIWRKKPASLTKSPQIDEEMNDEIPF